MWYLGSPIEQKLYEAYTVFIRTIQPLRSCFNKGNAKQISLLLSLYHKTIHMPSCVTTQTHALHDDLQTMLEIVILFLLGIIYLIPNHTSHIL